MWYWLYSPTSSKTARTARAHAGVSSPGAFPASSSPGQSRRAPASTVRSTPRVWDGIVNFAQSP